MRQGVYLLPLAAESSSNQELALQLASLQKGLPPEAATTSTSAIFNSDQRQTFC